MAKKKIAKKTVKAKVAKPAKIAKTAKAAKKAPKAAKKPAVAPIAKAVAKKVVKVAPAPLKPSKATSKPSKTAKAVPAPAPNKAVKGKKGKAGDLVEVVIAPSNPILRDKRKEGVVLKEASSGKKRCREAACDNEGIMGGYCRLHYIKNWRRIKRKEAILASGQLNNYVEELVKKYPDKYLDVIRQDLASEKEWAKVVVDLELESSDDDAGADEEIDTVAEGVRHDRDFEDDDGGF